MFAIGRGFDIIKELIPLFDLLEQATFHWGVVAVCCGRRVHMRCDRNVIDSADCIFGTHHSCSSKSKGGNNGDGRLEAHGDRDAVDVRSTIRSLESGNRAKQCFAMRFLILLCSLLDGIGEILCTN